MPNGMVSRGYTRTSQDAFEVGRFQILIIAEYLIVVSAALLRYSLSVIMHLINIVEGGIVQRSVPSLGDSAGIDHHPTHGPVHLYQV